MTATNIAPPAPLPITRRPRNLIWRVLVLSLLALSGAYALSVGGFLLLRLLTGERWFIIALFTSIVHLMVLPSLILLPLVLIFGRGWLRWVVALELVPVVMVTLFWYVPDFLPKNVAAVGDAPVLTILSYNITSERTDMNAVAAVIRKTDADVVALQKVDTRSGERLIALLEDAYPHNATALDEDPLRGHLLFSRYPILSDEAFANRQGKLHQRVEIDFDGQAVVVYNLHIFYPFVGNGFAYRAEDVQEVMARAEAETLPTILAGDFNLTPQTADYARIRRTFSDAHREAGQGLGFTFGPREGIGRFFPWFRVALPIARIDFVFYRDGLRALASQVIPDSAESGHYPLLARFALEQP
ncbi:MAG: endonuclease/exonuclease/phosphatase family protein [bacterium]|nr:endonuclease/exonuclease/phosphatase family protein [bacterium]